VRSSAIKIIFGVLCGLLAAGLIRLVSSPPRGEPVKLLPPPTAAPLMVHVAGAVAQPGVYTLPPESRVQDAIQAAGGALPEADLSTLNLAAFVQDGMRITVPTPPPKPAAGESINPAQRTPTAITLYPININIATQAELESLPGIGPATAKAIIEYRDTNGLFTRIEDIMNVPDIGPKTFERIKELITV
jgi:competence protein ComEA